MRGALAAAVSSLSAWALVAAPAAAAPPPPVCPGEGKPVAAPDVHPDGRLEIAPSVGWVRFDRALALESGPFFGGELHHHFRVGHPRFAIGAYFAAEGAFSRVVGTDRDVDVIVSSLGVSFGVRGLPRLLPVVRAGAGFVVVDGTPSDLDIRGRFVFHVGAGLRWYPVGWLVVRGDARLLVHDNVQFGAGSGQLVNVVHVAATAGVGFVL